MAIPTLKELKDQYLEAALVERLKTSKPSPMTVRNTLSGIRMFCTWLKEDAPDLGAGLRRAAAPAFRAMDAALLRRHWLGAAAVPQFRRRQPAVAALSPAAL